MADPTSTPGVVLDFWFGPLDAHGEADDAHARRWFERNEAFDREIAERFGALHEEIVKRRHEDWLDEPSGRLAYVIVLDQFSRNMFRGSPRAFAADGQALAAAAEGVARGHDAALTRDERSFLYLPFMHSEELAMQDRALALYAALAAGSPADRPDRPAKTLKYAEKHREVIARFGRFPQRNSAFGRTSTADEWEFLKANPGF
ncbi:MAG TPA: DUF924 family protein [Polyangia bacterium]|jgi:uncharacterized protein (DUF924 family)